MKKGSKKAHIGFHKKYGFKNNTKEQIADFLGWQGVDIINQSIKK